MRYFVREGLLFFIVLLISAKSFSSPGDTTWVQAHNNVQLDWYNNFDASVSFPNGSVTYRKIIMIFTLGKYSCPGNPQYCGDWDYTVQNFLMTPTDTFELARLITPYANASYPRTGWSWKQRYYFDVTNYYPVLKNAATIRVNYQGWSGGFTANIRFAFIEGTPPRNVTGIQRLWHGSFLYGNTTDPIENHLPALNTTVPANTQQANMQFAVTGHGADDANCSEFCSKYYDVLFNGALLDKKTIWKNDCGSNNLYPQSGTWIYNRAGWCPGELVTPYLHQLGNVTPGAALNTDVNFQSHTAAGGTNPPSYLIESALFFYGAPNKTLDASIENILAPSDYEGNFRMNPICGKPVVAVKNTGSATINAITFEYGVVGQTLQTYTINNIALASMRDTMLSLPDLSVLTSLPAGSPHRFTVAIQQVNGGADEYAINNSMQNTFVTAPEWPGQFTVSLRTNSNGTDTRWRVEDMNGTVYGQSNATRANTTYVDSVVLPDGCYKLVVTDTRCDGLYFFNTTGRGWLNPMRYDGSMLPLSNGLHNQSVEKASDFGCGYTQFFTVNNSLPAAQLLLKGTVKKDSTNALSWETSSEENADRFVVEYANNDSTYVPVGTVKAVGHTFDKSTYSLNHKPALQAPYHYYRLRLYYLDGSWKYSNTIKLSLPSAQLPADLMADVRPNPFTQELSVYLEARRLHTGEIMLYDLHGRLLFKKAINVHEGNNIIPVKGLAKLSAGVYMMVIHTDGQKIVKRLIRQ
jgi:hypothetical protein